MVEVHTMEEYDYDSRIEGRENTHAASWFFFHKNGLRTSQEHAKENLKTERESPKLSGWPTPEFDITLFFFAPVHLFMGYFKI